jgi:hypothetical protein
MWPFSLPRPVSSLLAHPKLASCPPHDGAAMDAYGPQLVRVESALMMGKQFYDSPAVSQCVYSFHSFIRVKSIFYIKLRGF